MGERLFAAVVPPSDVIEEMGGWVDPRRDDAWRWTDAGEWHITVAFYADVETWRYDALVDGLQRVTQRTRAFPLSLRGVGCFASVATAHVLYAGVHDPAGALPPLATGCRTAATTVGIEVARQRYHPHVTLARRNRPSDASRHVRALTDLQTSSWEATEVVLVQTFLGQGPGGTARHVVREWLPLPNGSGPSPGQP